MQLPRETFDPPSAHRNLWYGGVSACLVGLTVLPTYFNYFEKPQAAGSVG